MTKQEAIAAMQKGNRVKHSLFSSNEWMKMNEAGEYEFEDGYTMDVDTFWSIRDQEYWENNWKIVK